jgi:hypothetical protein
MGLGGRWLIVGVVTSTAALIAVAGWLYARMFADPTENGRAYANQIRVASGYVDISVNHDGSDSCNCVQRWYVGPAGADPSVVFSGPGLAWSPLPTAAANTSWALGWEPLATAHVTTSDTGRCSLQVGRETPAYGLHDVVNMSADQVAGWNDRRLDVLELYVQCERDTGRF